MEILRTETNVKYEGRKAVIVPLDVPVECTFEQLTDMISSRTTIYKQRFKLLLNCKYPLKSGNRFQHFPIWDDSSVYRMLNMVNITSIREIELYIEVVRVKAQMNQYVGGHIDLLVRDNYNVAEFDYGCGPNSGLVPDTRVYGDDVSTNPDAEILDESSPVHYHLPPTAQFKHVENLGNAISSAWTPWVQHSTGYSSGEFVVG